MCVFSKEIEVKLLGIIDLVSLSRPIGNQHRVEILVISLGSTPLLHRARFLSLFYRTLLKQN